MFKGNNQSQIFFVDLGSFLAPLDKEIFDGKVCIIQGLKFKKNWEISLLRLQANVSHKT